MQEILSPIATVVGYILLSLPFLAIFFGLKQRRNLGRLEKIVGALLNTLTKDFPEGLEKALETFKGERKGWIYQQTLQIWVSDNIQKAKEWYERRRVPITP